jgi:large subunit ribosomal protein L24
MAKKKAHAPRIRRGDLVTVLSGDDRGQRGRVLRILPDDDQVVVEGVNLVYRHIRRSQKHPQGGRLRREAPIHVSNVMVVDPDTDQPTRIGKRQQDPAKGSLGWVRVARKTGNDLDEGGKPTKKSKKKEKEPKE